MRILVIEDNPDDALAIERALKGTATVDFADSGAAGIQKAIQDQYDAVVLDYRLGDLTGTEVMLQLREKKQNVPVIIASGMGSHFIVARSLALGAREFVNKDEADFAAKLVAAVHHVTESAGPSALPAATAKSGPGDVPTRATEVKQMINSILEASDLVSTVGIVGADGALIHGHIQDKSGAGDVTAVLAGTVQMMLSTVAHHLGLGQARSFVASYDKGSIAMAPLPGNLVLYFTSNAGPDQVDALRAEIEESAAEFSRVIQPRKRTA